jgi:maltose alpha-D-glucosyltransferase / alpha-amylase
MQWSDDPQAGFSSAKKTVLPVISKGPYSYERVNVEAQRRDINSLLNWTERLIRLRKECPEIGWGTNHVLNTGDSSVLCTRYDWRNNSVITLHNFNEKPRSITIDPDEKNGAQLTNLFAGEHSHAGPDGKHRIILEGYGYRWYRVGDLRHILKREKF